MEQMDGCRLMHARNGREYRPPQLAKYSLDGYCPGTKIIYEFFRCFWHGHACQPFRDVSTISGDTLAERYEGTMSRLEQISLAGYKFKIQCECEFDQAVIVNQKT
jgi:G:T-mismatch repair DNA endonuclease (very short patch repair protein)